MSYIRRHRSEAVQIASRERAVLTIDTPMGPKEVAYGHEREYKADRFDNVAPYGKGRDTFFLTYRSQELWGSDLANLVKQVEKIEAEFQAKKRVEKVRKEAASNPLPALYVPNPRQGRDRWGHERFEARLEEVHVRGIDQRSGKALITRANGDKEQVSGEFLVRDLDASDRADLMALYRAYLARTREAEQAKAGRSIRKVLKERGVEIDLTVRLDPETMQRVTEFQGEEIRGSEDEELIHQVLYRLVKDEYPFVEGSKSDTIMPIGDLAYTGRYRGSLGPFTTVYPSMEAYEAERAAVEAQDEAAEAILAAHKDLQFDLSQFQVQEPQEEPEQADEEQVQVSVQASGYEPEWDD